MMTMFFVMALMAMAPGSGQSQEGENPQLVMMIKDSIPAGQQYALMMKSGRNASGFLVLAELYEKESKPIHAARHYKQALVLDEKNDNARQGLATAEARIKELESKIKGYEQKYVQTSDYTNYCSKSAVLFHMGKGQEAFRVLEQVLQKNPENREILGLRYTFRQGLIMRGQAVQKLETVFSEALAVKKLDDALTTLGQIVFVSLATYPTGPLVEKLVEVFPEQVKKDNLAGVLENVAKY